VAVLLWSDNRILADLVTQNLVRRGFNVHETPLPEPDAPAAVTTMVDPDATLAVLDLDAPEPELWDRAGAVRTLMPCIPLVILGHAWPTTAHLDRLQPCTYVRKPFAIDELLTAIQDVPANLGSQH
jgi:DNA-binding response OmpR family regulator